jgi:hypothetical protein
MAYSLWSVLRQDVIDSGSACFSLCGMPLGSQKPVKTEFVTSTPDVWKQTVLNSTLTQLIAHEDFIV